MNKDKKVKYVKIDEDYNDLDYESENPRPKTSGKKKAKKPEKITPLTVIGKTVEVIGTTIAAMILVIIIALCITVTGLALYVTQFAESDFDVNLDDAELSSSTFLYAYDANGNEVQLKQLSTDENRVLITLDDLPQHVIDAFISVEDKRFYEHEGVDWKRTVALLVKSVFSDNSQGGSTITQQLVRDVTGDKEVSYGRKLREIFRALEMEKKYSKKDILESYLNRIPLGGTTYGIASASMRYFGKSPDQLTIAEAALLAGIVRSPGRNPYEDPEYSRDKEVSSLGYMLSCGYITTQEYNQALNEQIRFVRPIKGSYFGYVDERYSEYYGVQDDSNDNSDLYYENSTWEELGVNTDNSYVPYTWNGDYEVNQNWYMDAAIEQIISDLADLKGVTKDAARALFYKGGFKAYLNMNMEMQDKLEEMFSDPNTCLSKYDAAPVVDLPETAENEIDIRKRDLIQGSFIITNYSGSVLALVGGLGEKEGNGCFNRATQDPQIIGSTIKPLAVYSPAIENNVLTYSTLIKDQSGKIPAEALGAEAVSGYDPEDNTVRWPHNYQEEGFGSQEYVPAWYAVQKSMNTIAVNTLSKVGLQTAFTQLSEKLHFTLDPVNDMAYSPLALGSITEGVTLTQLAAAYSMMGNGGLYYHPYLYSKVVDSEGRTVLSQNVMGERVISSDTAYIVNRMMRQVCIDPTGSGRHAQLENIEVVGKTGTANDESTLSFVGLTPNYVACYRISRDNHKPIYKNSGWKTVPAVWGEVMKEITAGEPAQTFTKDSNVKELNYCTVTGLIAGSNCEDTKVGYYRASSLPPVCDGNHEEFLKELEENDEIPFYG